jgi:C4-type Zn-finger protein
MGNKRRNQNKSEGTPVVCPVCRRKRLMDVVGQPAGDFQVTLKCPICGLVSVNAEYLKKSVERLLVDGYV